MESGELPVTCDALPKMPLGSPNGSRFFDRANLGGRGAEHAIEIPQAARGDLRFSCDSFLRQGQPQGIYPFELKLDHASSFADGAQVWWLGVHTVPPEVLHLRQELQKQISAAGLSVERGKFAPHVTFQRTNRKLPATRIDPVIWKVSEFALLRSTLLPQGSVYEEVGRWKLSGRQDVPPAGQISLL